MAPRFGTSGLRGLVSDLTDGLCAGYVRAFLTAIPHDGTLMIARDLRASSPRIAAAVAAGAESLGVAVTDCGEVPTPALALAAMSAGAPSVMVTGSHIPADRNGLKFYTAAGEITKADETAILSAYQGAHPCAARAVRHHPDAGPGYMRRYIDAFGEGALAGLTIGVYRHSSVARDLLTETLGALGARVIPLGQSASFIPVDTEAVSPETRHYLARWAAEKDMDAIVSTDGDADRPLVTDHAGAVIAGDILGVLTARFLGATHVVTPVSSTTMIDRTGAFTEVIRTRIGSPHVIAGMEEAGRDPAARVAGFEANGGFLLGFDADCGQGMLPALMTRDAFLPILAPLADAARQRIPLSGLLAELPPRVTASDRAENMPTEASLDLIAGLSGDAAARADFLRPFGQEASLDQTDGLRITLHSGAIVHLRPSGNAPELRAYAEADTQEAAEAMVALALQRARDAMGK